ncbi:MAG: TetR/AcrR family transcriptional regulator [Rhodococcus sp. (in: high G+C Gram-positive bacteria)]
MTTRTGGASATTSKQRRRSTADVNDAVFEAVREELAELGYQGLTMVGVARRAGTSRRALYMRWTTKEQMIYDSVIPSVPTSVTFVSTGDLRTDLIGFVCRVTVFEGTLGRAIRSMIAESYRDPTAQTGGVRDRLMAASSAGLRQLLLEAIARGEAVLSALDAEVLTVIDAVVFHQHCISPDPISKDLATGIVDRILLPMVRSEGYAVSPN